MIAPGPWVEYSLVELVTRNKYFHNEREQIELNFYTYHSNRRYKPLFISNLPIIEEEELSRIEEH